MSALRSSKVASGIADEEEKFVMICVLIAGHDEEVT